MPNLSFSPRGDQTHLHRTLTSTNLKQSLIGLQSRRNIAVLLPWGKRPDHFCFSHFVLLSFFLVNLLEVMCTSLPRTLSHICMPGWMCCGQKTIPGTQFSPATLWDPGTEVKVIRSAIRHLNLLGYLAGLVWDGVSCSSGWPQTYYMDEGGLEVSAFLPLYLPIAGITGLCSTQFSSVFLVSKNTEHLWKITQRLCQFETIIKHSI